MKLKTQQVVARAQDHPSRLLETTITHCKLLCITAETPKRRSLMAILCKTADTVPVRVDEKYHRTIRKMLAKHENMWWGKLGKVNVTTNSVSFKPNVRPFESAPYRDGPKTRELEQSGVTKQLTAGVIEPSNLEWADPVLFAPKKDGKLWFYIDYRKVNELTIKDSYPLLRMHECIYSLREGKVFTTLHAYSGYWHIPIRKENKAKTAFVGH